jgi:hypothetical protein
MHINNKVEKIIDPLQIAGLHEIGLHEIYSRLIHLFLLIFDYKFSF